MNPDTSHIKATRAALLRHLETCPFCRQYEGEDWPECQDGQVMLAEYRQALELRVTEHLTATEATPCLS